MQAAQAQARTHLLEVWLVAVLLLMATYFVNDAQRLRPGRVLGPLGLPMLWEKVLPSDDGQLAASVPPQVQQESVPTQSPHEPASTGASSGREPDRESDREPARGAAEARPQTEVEARPSPPPPLPERPGIAQAIEGGVHLIPFFSSLAKSDSQVTRVLHYGDSTLAGDGIAKTVRSRMKERFGDGGAGFFVAGMDERWMRRDDVRVSRDGEWDIHTILFGGNNGRYGLGGVSARPKGAGTVHVSAARKAGTLGRQIEIYSNLSRSEEPLRLLVNGQPAEGLQRQRQERFDRWTLQAPEDVASLRLAVREPGLEIYGIVTEAMQGITWETAAVVGIATGSMRQF
ncbi:MAG: hypothetical protein RLZ51_1538, partial [Pseudomonadota bacterium]